MGEPFIDSDNRDCCSRCAGCDERVCFEADPSPGDKDGLCLACWLTEDDEGTAA